MTCLEIIKAYLIANKYDGLYYDDCGCLVSDLMPCGEYCGGCEPGYIYPGKDGSDYMVGPPTREGAST